MKINRARLVAALRVAEVSPGVASTELAEFAGDLAAYLDSGGPLYFDEPAQPHEPGPATAQREVMRFVLRYLSHQLSAREIDLLQQCTKSNAWGLTTGQERWWVEICRRLGLTEKGDPLQAEMTRRKDAPPIVDSPLPG